MEDPLINLEAINAITDPFGAVILTKIAEKKRATFKELIEITGLSNAGLIAQLEKLQRYSIIKGELADPKEEEGSYLFYHLTKMGEEFHILLHDVLHKTKSIKPEPMSDKLVVDATSFLTIANQKTLPEIKELFQGCKIIFTNRDFTTSMSFAETNDKETLVNFLNNPGFVDVSTTYKDKIEGTRTEYYLRRARKLEPHQARLISTAKDLDASIITDDEKVFNAARSLGIKCVNSSSILQLQKGEILWKKFYELSLRDLESQKRPHKDNVLEIFKKNKNFSSKIN